MRHLAETRYEKPTSPPPMLSNHQKHQSKHCRPALFCPSKSSPPHRGSASPSAAASAAHGSPPASPPVIFFSCSGSSCYSSSSSNECLVGCLNPSAVLASAGQRGLIRLPLISSGSFHQSSLFTLQRVTSSVRGSRFPVRGSQLARPAHQDRRAKHRPHSDPKSHVRPR